MQVVQIAGPADEGGRPPLRKAQGPLLNGIDLQRLEGFDRVGIRLQAHRSVGSRPHLPGNQVEGGPAQQARPRRSGAFHALGQIDGLTDRPILEVEVILCRRHHEFARTQPDSDLGSASRGRSAAFVSTSHGMDRFGCEARPQRMVFLSPRDPEQGHDAVAQHLIDRSAKPVNRVDQDLQNAEKALVRLLRVIVQDQIGRLRNVGEQDRDELAFAVD